MREERIIPPSSLLIHMRKLLYILAHLLGGRKLWCFCIPAAFLFCCNVNSLSIMRDARPAFSRYFSIYLFNGKAYQHSYSQKTRNFDSLHWGHILVRFASISFADKGLPPPPTPHCHIADVECVQKAQLTALILKGFFQAQGSNMENEMNFTSSVVH